MKILHVTDTYLPTLGGIEVQVHGLTQAQKAAGHDVAVLTTTPGPSGREATQDPVPVLRGAPVGAALSGIDAVHVHLSGISPLALSAARQATDTGIPVVATVHSMWTGVWPAARLGLAVSRRDVRSVQWAAVSAAAAAPVRRAVGSGHDVLVLPNAIDTNIWRPDRSPSCSAEVTVVSVMRMTRRKRPLALLRMLRRVRAAVPATIALRAIVVGAGPLLEAARHMARADGMAGWVSLPGALDHAQIQSLYRTADVFVAPARLESFGIAALEARTSGLAILARRGTGIGDFVEHGVDGLLSGSDQEMAHHLTTLSTDPDLLPTIVEHNVRCPPPYDWQDTLWRTDLAYAAAAGRTTVKLTTLANSRSAAPRTAPGSRTGEAEVLVTS